MLYWILQGITCFLWFLFSIWAVGPWCGWAQIYYLHVDPGNDTFAIILTIMECLLLTFMFFHGVGLIVATVLLKSKDPTDNTERIDEVTSEMVNRH
jgi:hypothetical protein